MRERIQYIDSLKGFAIILVVMGHVIQMMYCVNSFDSDPIFRFIYSFHMPLFMMISGMVRRDCEIIDKFKYCNKLRSSFLQLVLPFLFWRFFVYLVFDVDSFFSVFRYPDNNGLWFLWILFIINIIYYTIIFLCNSLHHRNIVTLILMFFIYTTLKLLSELFNGEFGFYLLFRFFPYFCIGAFLPLCDSLPNKKTILYCSLVISGLLFFSTVHFWYRNNIFDGESYWVGLINKSVYSHMPTELAGCAFFISLFYLNSFSLVNKFLSYFGKITLPIYAVHQYIIKIAIVLSTQAGLIFYTTKMGLLVSFASVLSLSLLFVQLVKQVRFLSIFMFGKSF